MQMVRKVGLLLIGAVVGAVTVLAVLSGLNHSTSAQAAGVSTLSVFAGLMSPNPQRKN